VPNPEKIGRYRILRSLGSGAFATVWLGADDTLDVQVAIKVLAENWAHRPDIRTRFVQEARIMRRVDSRRLVTVLDIDELQDGRPYFVMPYASGGTLNDRLAGGPPPVAEGLAVMVEVARAVTVLHGMGVLHRDLKPSNILFDTVAGQERVLVTDLGLAKDLANASGFTVSAGTPGYMPPEQARVGGGLDERADVYALGAVAYRVLTGQLPDSFEGGRPIRPSNLRPGIPSAVDDAVLRALETDPRDRWPSAEALAAALHPAAALAEQSEPGGKSRRRHRVRRRPWRTVALAAVVAVLAGGAGAVWASQAHTVRASDATGGLTLTVPSAWAGQVRDAGWDPSVLGLPAGHAPGLAISPNLSTWANPDSAVPGVFVGASKALGSGGTAPTLPDHSGCVRAPDRTVSVAGTTAQVHRWTGCDGTSVSFDELVFAVPGRNFGVYVQIKQVDSTDRTNTILGDLRLTSTLAPQTAHFPRPPVPD
jgi:hypothetical protein